MNKKLYVSFDTEMTKLDKEGDMISIGLVDTHGKHAFYAEITDFDKSKMSDWVADNIIPCLLFNECEKVERTQSKLDRRDDDVVTIVIKDTFENVSKCLNDWLDTLISERYSVIQFVSDVACYDFVHIVDLITNKGDAIDLRKDISPTVIDINQLMDMPIVRNIFEITEESFDVGREALLLKITGDESSFCESNVEKNKHNSLFDAVVISILFEHFKDTLGIYKND